MNLYVICRNNCVNQIDYLGRYLWYVIYYDEDTVLNNFKRAAETCKANIGKSSAFNSKCDTVEIYAIRTMDDFTKTWDTLNAHSRRKSKRITRFQVKGLYLYTHSGPGQLFLRGDTIHAYQIRQMPSLNWASGAEIYCFGCSSGVKTASGESVAGSFHSSQNVSAIGQASKSSFSSNPSEKSKWGVVLGFSEVYLWAFDEHGKRIAPVKYPEK